MSLIDKASLIQIPSGYKSTKLYSIEPTNGDGDFTFARSSSATRVNSEGLIEEMSANVPRLDYSGGASCASLLLEPQRTNLIRFSESFENSYWLKLNNVIVSGTKVTSPDGNLNASQLVFDGTALGRIERAVTGLTSGADYSVSIYARVSSGTQVVSFGSVSEELFTLTTEWQRLTRTEAENNTTGYPRFICNDAATIEVWGFQLEQGSYPTSYIISNSNLQTTRTADVCNGAGTSATFNDSEGVLFWDGYIPNDGNEKILQISDGTNNNVVRIFARANGNDVRFQIIVAGVNSFSQEIPMSSNNIYKTSLKYKENDIAIWVNGFELYNANSGSMPSNLNTLEFNSDGDANTFYGKTKQLMVFDEALSDEELSDLTGQVNLSFNNLATFYGYTIL